MRLFYFTHGLSPSWESVLFQRQRLYGMRWSLAIADTYAELDDSLRVEAARKLG